MELRYMGFEQNRNTRTYKFDGVANGQPTVHFVVTADLALFLVIVSASRKAPPCVRANSLPRRNPPPTPTWY
jgi:hypothetical protein